MQMFVLIKKGVWRGTPIENQIFPLHQKFKAKNGSYGHVIVIGNEANGLNNANCRISCNKEDLEYVDQDGNPVDLSTISVGSTFKEVEMDYEKKYLESESEEEALARIGHTFEMFEQIVDAVPNGEIRGLIISGPPGIGKTFTVQDVMYRNYGDFDPNGITCKYNIVSGYASAIAIYKTLYMHSKEGDITIFDDCDDALYDETALNILKVALDSGERRNICWLAESMALKREDIPDRFEFKGKVIFLTNMDFEKNTSKIRPHLDAMMSRCHYLDLEMSSQRDQLLRIRQVVDAGLLNKYNLNAAEVDMLMDFVSVNFNFLREHSLRIVTKIADIYKTNPGNWVPFVEQTCLRKQFRYERLYKQKHAATNFNALTTV